MLIEIEKYIALFFIYSFAGWLMESVSDSIKKKKLVNRGFLIGPYCPIYGTGVVLITILLKKYSDDIWATFFMSLLICGTLEYLTSYIMEKIFNARWWDYSKNKFNINGRICLETLIPFGVAGTFIIYIANPFLLKYINMVPELVMNIFTIVFLVVYITDMIVSFRIILNLKEMSKEFKDNTTEISDRVRKIIKKKYRWYRRLVHAFPKIKENVVYNKWEEIKTKLEESKSKYPRLHRHKEEKGGLSLISLTIAVVILITISSMLLYNAKSGIKIRKLEMMKNDISLLSDKLNSYYVEYGAIPAEIEYSNTILLKRIKDSNQIGENDNDVYYVIDLKALDGVTLNYGRDFSNISTEEDTKKCEDVYIVNEQSHKVYYVKGIEMDRIWYYTDTDDDETGIVLRKEIKNYNWTMILTEKSSGSTITDSNGNDKNGYRIGDTIEYSITIENTGDKVLNNLQMNLQATGKNGGLKNGGVTIDNDETLLNTLQPREKKSYNFDYVVMAGDGIDEEINMNAIVTAYVGDNEKDTVKKEASVKSHIEKENVVNVSLEETSTSASGNGYGVGEVVTHECIFENLLSLDITNVAIEVEIEREDGTKENVENITYTEIKAKENKLVCFSHDITEEEVVGSKAKNINIILTGTYNGESISEKYIFTAYKIDS